MAAGVTMRAVIVAVLLAVVVPVANAQGNASTRKGASVQRARACVAATEGKHLTDAQYHSFMRACLASKRPPAELFENARTIERRCNTIANARQLNGEGRIEFMQSCRRKGG
jgi:type II secretory pathway pseudopilin PulG